MALQAGMLTDPLTVLYAKIKRTVIRNRGEIGLLSLSRAFRGASAEDDLRLKPSDFFGVLESFGASLRPEEQTLLQKTYDIRGGIGVFEFITALRSSIDPKRKSRIARSWMSLPKNALGNVGVSDLHASFNAAAHPSVLSGASNESDVFGAFCTAFSSSTNPHGVTREDFEEYWGGVSATLDSDERFALMLNNVWGLSSAKRTMASTATSLAPCHIDGISKLPSEYTLSDKESLSSTVRARDNTHTFLQRLKKDLSARIGLLATLGRLLRERDPHRCGSLSRQEFGAVVHLSGARMTEEELWALFDQFDHDGSGSVNYEEFMFCLRDDIPPRRRRMIERAFNSIPKTTEGTVRLMDLLNAFRVVRHPHVAHGLTTADAVRREFEDAFAIAQNRDGAVSYEEFEEFFSGVSTSIPNDKHFETMMISCFGL